MYPLRIKHLQSVLQHPLLIKKKENLLYLTGRSFIHGYLLVKPRNNAELNPDAKVGAGAERRGRKPSVVFLGDGLERIEGIHSDFLKNVGMYINPRQTLEVFGEFTYAEVKYIKYKNPKLKLKVTVKHDPVDHLRMVKDETEIGYIKKSMQIVEKVFGLVRKEIKKPGMTEIRLAEFIKHAGHRFGAQDISFPPIVASGANAAVPHHVPSSKRLKAGESVILDFGFKYKNYCSDFTRTIFLKKVDRKMESAYNQVEKAYWESLGYINERNSLLGSDSAYRNSERETRSVRHLPIRATLPNNASRVLAGDVYQKAVDVLAEKKLEKYFIHSLGHGTGLEIHELPNLSPNSRDILQNGAVFSIEPGVYLPKQGGIRIEDLVYLKKGKIQKFIKVSTRLEDNII